MKYKKKPVTIEAFQWGFDEIPIWWKDKSNNFKINIVDGSVIIPTLEGNHTANIGDFIIQGIKGELYPCKANMFHITHLSQKNKKEVWHSSH